MGQLGSCGDAQRPVFRSYLTSKVLRSTSADDVAESRIAAWEERNWEGQQRARATLSEIDASGHYDLATLSVALRSCGLSCSKAQAPDTPTTISRPRSLLRRKAEKP